jgi:hypothetical protein
VYTLGVDKLILEVLALQGQDTLGTPNSLSLLQNSLVPYQILKQKCLPALSLSSALAITYLVSQSFACPWTDSE